MCVAVSAGVCIKAFDHRCHGITKSVCVLCNRGRGNPVWNTGMYQSGNNIAFDAAQGDDIAVYFIRGQFVYRILPVVRYDFGIGTRR